MTGDERRTVRQLGARLVVSPIERCNHPDARGPGQRALEPRRAAGSRRVDYPASVLYLLRRMSVQGTVPPAVPGIRSAGAASAAGLLLLAAAACGGGAPLLHPAQPLPPDTVSFGAGLSGQFVSSDVANRIDRGRAAAAGPLADPATARAYAEGVLIDALLGPGISPWVSARVGLPRATEAGLTYTGRSLRLDGRHVLSLGSEWALSLGLGASAVLLHPDSSAPDAPPGGSAPAEFGLDANGWGGDIPILVGYQPLDGFVDVWMGARTGFEHISGELRAEDDDPAATRFDASGNRFWAAALAGVSLGVPPVWFRFELAGTFHRLSGKLRGPEGQPPLSFGELDASGWSLTPSGAILGKF